MLQNTAAILPVPPQWRPASPMLGKPRLPWQSEKVFYTPCLFTHNHLPRPACWDPCLIYWYDPPIEYVGLMEESRAGHCRSMLLLWCRLPPTIPAENLPDLAHMFWHAIWSKLEQACAGFPCSALNSNCGKPLTLLHLVSNLNAFYISIYYVWTLKISTRGGFFPTPSSQPAAQSAYSKPRFDINCLLSCQGLQK